MKTFVLSFVVCLATTLTYSQRQNAIPEGITIQKDIPYLEGGHEKQKLDLYVPEESGEALLPLVVWIHGGGWAKGSKSGIRNCSWVLDEGYALASIGYRLTDAAVFPAQLEDCKAGIEWLKENGSKHGVDPGKIVVWGSSAGGHLVSMLGTTGDPDDDSDNLLGVINWFGPAELLTMQEQRVLPVHLNADAPDSFESRLVGATLQEAPEKAKAASPVSHITPDDTPMLIMHGTEDALVPLKQSQLFSQQLKKAGVAVHLEIIEGAGHGGPMFQTPEARGVIREFLEERFASE